MADHPDYERRVLQLRDLSLRLAGKAAEKDGFTFPLLAEVRQLREDFLSLKSEMAKAEGNLDHSPYIQGIVEVIIQNLAVLEAQASRLIEGDTLQ